MPFQIHALDSEPFAPLFALSDEALRERGAVRETITESPGTPCRVSLADAVVGETVVLVNHEHQPGPGPYRASHAVFVREGMERARPAPGEVPGLFRSRLISLRAFDEAHMMVAADAVEGTELEAALETALADARVAYIHLHYAKPGCFAASVTRA